MNPLASLFTNWPKKLQKYKVYSESTISTNDKKCDKIKSWEDKAIDLLVKKLKERPELLVLLEKVLEQKREDTPCIPIPKTQDGRIQINRTKLFPHYIYCKLWRWPDLNQANELKKASESCCSSSLSRKSSEVCVNPYHYERVSTDLFAASLQQQMFYNNHNSNSNSFSSNDQSLVEEPMNVQSMNEEQMNPNESYYYTPDYNSPASYCLDNSHISDFNYNLNFNTSTNQEMSRNGFNNNYDNEPYDAYMQTTSPEPMNSEYQSSYQNNYQQNYQNNYQNGYQDSFKNKYQNSMPSNWCSIVYFKKKDRQGRHTIVENQHLISGHNLRGYLNLNEGLEVKNINGEVFVESYNCEVFIQSPFLNMINNLSPECVLKLNRLTPTKIFDENLFEDMIRRNYQMGYEALSDLVKYSKCTLSFNYGWGRDFQNSSVLQSKFWLEITMDRSLSILDKPLSQLNASNQKVTSFS